MGSTIRTILDASFDASSRESGYPRYVHRATQMLRACRTGRLGSHVQRCPSGHFERVVPHSCHHRLCPQCNALPRAQWLEKMQSRLIDCAHHHLIFTIPHTLHEVWRYNRVWFTQALFAAVAETLQTLCADESYMGAQPGLMLALHTWGRALPLHPHIHALLTNGGLTDDGRWQDPKRSCVLPARVVMALYRGKLLSKLRSALEQGALVVPPDCRVERLGNLLNRLGRDKWNVHVCRRYAHGAGVMTYLARYVRGGPLKDGQVSMLSDGRVRLSYQPHAEDGGCRRKQSLVLSAASFIRRYLQHTPLPRKPVVRHYGLYATRCTPLLERARQAHGQAPRIKEAPTPLKATEYYLRVAGHPTHATHCPQCGGALVKALNVVAPRGPPTVAET